jgi:hypothetical protein
MRGIMPFLVLHSRQKVAEGVEGELWWPDAPGPLCKGIEKCAMSPKKGFLKE